ncbi:MAG: phytanoyl-CoA dioxygenase family protein [Proteobacteria bacterium]|nr:phytanoyl-CoA dioxygenase family protein [Pseudomonadota bacterium]
MNAAKTPLSIDARLPRRSVIDRTVDLDVGTVDAFHRDGHVVVRNLASRSEIARYRPAIEAAVQRLALRYPPIAERDTYGKAFIQALNLWRRDARIKRFVFSARFARVAADLMGVPGVRLYHDQALFKEPDGGHTPWHQDQAYWPLDTEDTITMWMPLVDIPAEIGTMTFASGSHSKGELGRFIIGDESHERFGEVVERLGFEEHTFGAMKAGDATFHRGLTLHRAAANLTSIMRGVMTIIWFADGTRVSADIGGARFNDHKFWLAEIPPGELAAGPLNPLLWPRPERRVRSTRPGC